MTVREANFDGLVGPTHNYAGLSYGNVASASNEGQVSNPREGVLQGLGKARHMLSLGMVQGILPPHERPHLPTLRGLGFTGGDDAMLASAWAASPALVANIASSAAMWTANAATITPAPDSADGRTHFTPANLAAMYHRSIEHPTTARVLKAIFPEGERFAHHCALEGGVHLGDEGAANHNRFCAEYGDKGASLYVYGRDAFAPADDLKYPGRQTREASEAIARLHGDDKARTLFVRQNPVAINAGAFHNDVVAVSNRNVFFYHELAFEDAGDVQARLRAAAPEIDFVFVEVADAEVPLRDAVKSYLFNSQLVDIPGRDGMTLILPKEVEETPSTKAYIDNLVASNGPIRHADIMDVRQSMRNGGGPACLRLRVVLSDDDIGALGTKCLLTPKRLDALEDWASTHYRDRLALDDLRDPALWREVMAALDALTGLLDLGSLYSFQRAGA